MPPPVLFLHGWAMRGATFDGIAARLGPEFRCLAPDLPGHGRAAGQTPGLDAAAEMLAQVIRPPVLLVGWSMGAAVAWRYIDRCGTGALAGLVTVDMSPKLLNQDGWMHGLKGQMPVDVARTTEQYRASWQGAAESVAAGMFADGAAADAAALRQVRENDPAQMLIAWEEMTAMDLRPVIGRIDIPYLVAFGARSRVYPASASAWIAAEAPRATLAPFNASGHSPHLEEPAAFAARIAAFARSLPA